MCKEETENKGRWSIGFELEVWNGFPRNNGRALHGLKMQVKDKLQR